MILELDENKRNATYGRYVVNIHQNRAEVN
jgi:hypothetical protein